MSCPNSAAPNAFLMEPLARGDNFPSGPGLFGPGGDFGAGRACGALPKRDELSLGSFPSYLGQLEPWAEPKSAFRIEAPVARQLPSCSFPVKEESACCMFSPQKRPKSSPEAPLFPAPLPEPCPPEPEVPVPGFYRFPSLEKSPDCSDFSAPFEARPSPERAPPPPAAAAERVSPKFQGNFPESAERPQGEVKTEQSGAGAKASAAEAEKERSKSADTASTDTSDCEAKGRREPAGFFLLFIHSGVKISEEYSGTRAPPSPAKIEVKMIRMVAV